MSEGIAPSMQGKIVNSQVSNPVTAALDALKSGKDVESTVYGSSSPSKSSEEPTPSEGFEKSFTESFMDGEEGSEASQSEGQQKDLPSSLDEIVPENAEAKDANKDVEEIIISDESGRKKITVDWNDRTKLKKYVEMAAGMRKFQAERDRVKAELSKVQSESREYVDSWTAIETAYSKEGIKGLINLVTGEADGYDKLLQRELGKLKARETATPSELERMDLEEKFQREARERQKLQAQVEAQLKKATEEREQASLKSLESRVLPAFEKHRFAGKLGDAKVEDRLDKAIWRETLEVLENYPDHVELTPSMIEKEFREASNTYRKLINKQAEEKTKQVIQKKKVAAQETAAVKAMSGMRSNDARDAFKNDIRKGDLTSALTSVLTGKFKF
jgi:hypothetical protein